MSAVEGWKTDSLGRVAQLTMGQSPDSKYYSADDKAGMSFLQGCAEFQSRFPASYLFCSQAKKVANRGSILFSVRAPVGKINIADRDYIIGRGLAAISGSEVDQDYLEHYLAYVEPRFRNASQGSTFEAINSTELNGWPIEYPTSKSEQTKIAEILSTVDLAIEQTEALIAKQQRIKTGLMQDLFTRGIDERGNLRSEQTHKFKNSPLGRIPVEWEVMQIENMCSDIVDCPHSTPVYIESGVPCIRTADMEPGHLLLATAFCLDEASYRKRVLRLVPHIGDIIYSREGERLGIASPVGSERVCLGQRVMLLRPSKETDSDYMLWSMNSRDFYVRAVSGLGATTSPHINVKDIRKTQIKKPHSAEQKVIGEMLSIQHSELRANKARLAKLLHLKTSLMQDLLTGKKRVIVLTNDMEKAAGGKRK